MLNDALLACQEEIPGGLVNTPIVKRVTLLYFLNTIDQFRVIVGVLFKQVRRGEGQNNQGLFCGQHVNAPGNGGSLDLSGAGFPIVSHSVVRILSWLTGSLNVLDGFGQFLVEVFDSRVE